MQLLASLVCGCHSATDSRSVNRAERCDERKKLEMKTRRLLNNLSGRRKFELSVVCHEFVLATVRRTLFSLLSACSEMREAQTRDKQTNFETSEEAAAALFVCVSFLSILACERIERIDKRH